MTKAKLLISTALFVLTYGYTAKADQVTAFYPPPDPAIDDRRCDFFQLQSTGDTWYEIPWSETNHDTQVAIVIAALSGAPVTSWGASYTGSQCGYQHNSLVLGFPQ